MIWQLVSGSYFTDCALRSLNPDIYMGNLYQSQRVHPYSSQAKQQQIYSQLRPELQWTLPDIYDLRTYSSTALENMTPARDPKQLAGAFSRTRDDGDMDSGCESGKTKQGLMRKGLDDNFLQSLLLLIFASSQQILNVLNGMPKYDVTRISYN